MTENTLNQARYISLATFRKSGERVATPVWFAQAGNAFYLFSAGNAGKVKRLRNNTNVQVAVCDMKGKLGGEWQDASADILINTEETDTALNALRGKYRLQMHLADWGAKLSGKFHKRAYIRFTLNS